MMFFLIRIYAATLQSLWVALHHLVEAKAVYKKWLIGDFSTPYPLGLYPPNLPKQIHLINALQVL
jgi:hypothetical protein